VISSLWCIHLVAPVTAPEWHTRRHPNKMMTVSRYIQNTFLQMSLSLSSIEAARGRRLNTMENGVSRKVTLEYQCPPRPGSSELWDCKPLAT
jgi:hypothetical protein